MQPSDEAAAALITAPDQVRLRRFGGWFVLGLAAFGGEVVLLGVLHQWLKCPLWLASALAAECVLLARFLSTDRLVFGYATPTLARCGRFHGAAVGSFAVSWLVLNGSASVFGVPYVAAAFLGSVAAFVWSGLTNFLWVWRSPPARDRLMPRRPTAVRLAGASGRPAAAHPADASRRPAAAHPADSDAWTSRRLRRIH